MNRRAFVATAAGAAVSGLAQNSSRIEQWGVFEAAFRGPDGGNPFTDVELTAQFSQAGRAEFEVDGFYDGGGVYRVRFMPDRTGAWNFTTRSNVAELNGKRGVFECSTARTGNHGPVRVQDKFHFAYADGTRYLPFGTTCYAWTHQGDSLEQQTLETLRTKGAGFNKIRFCVFPKNYDFNRNEPVHAPFVGGDFTRLNPACFQHLEKRILDLQKLGIEADLILFHPYDRWGYANMGAANDDRYLRYVIARVGAFRNVWWSVANEFNFVKTKTVADWDRFCRILKARDPYGRLLSIHNGGSELEIVYDHTKSWITHASVQFKDLTVGRQLRHQYGKPVIYDECYYEGDLARRWGDISAEEMVRRFWLGTVNGCYVGHGETYLDPKDVIWWSKGGELKGGSPARIAFLRRLLEDNMPGTGLTPLDSYYPSGVIEGRYALWYLDIHRPRKYAFDLPSKDGRWVVDVIDTWEMTIQKGLKMFQGRAEVDLPGKPHMAMQVRRVE